MPTNPTRPDALTEQWNLWMGKFQFLLELDRSFDYAFLTSRDVERLKTLIQVVQPWALNDTKPAAHTSANA